MNFCGMKIPQQVGFFCPTSGFTLCGGDLKMSLGMALPFIWPREVWMLFLCPSASFTLQCQEGALQSGMYLWGKTLGSQLPPINPHVTE